MANLINSKFVLTNLEHSPNNDDNNNDNGNGNGNDNNNVFNLAKVVVFTTPFIY